MVLSNIKQFKHFSLVAGARQVIGGFFVLELFKLDERKGICICRNMRGDFTIQLHGER